MNLNDSDSGYETKKNIVPPGTPRASDREDGDATRVGQRRSKPKGSSDRTPVPKAGDLILGVVVVYSETHESGATEIDSRLGRAYPLREGEILLVGRFNPVPTDVLRNDGSSGPPTYSHYFPTGGLYGYISRRHLTVEMDPLGGTILTDYSIHGIYLEKAGKWHRREDPSGPPVSHRVTGEEKVILMDELGEPMNRSLADRRSRYLLHILRPAKLVDRDRTGGTNP